MAKTAIVLLSGGLDSVTCAAMARADGFDIHALSFSYGQRHRVELEAAKRISATQAFKDHKISEIDLRLFGGSALTSEMYVPKGRTEKDMANEIPVTYVPARNTIFLSYALAYAEVSGAYDIYIGVNALDYSGYPDCRPDYIAAYQDMANLATKAGVTAQDQRLTIRTPLIHMSKAEIVKQGTALGVDYGMTVSCYDPDSEGRACGRCDSCLLRAKGFRDAGLADPTRYQTGCP